MKDFLDDLSRHRIVTLSPVEYLEVQRLISLRPEFTTKELRATLASLLATNPEQWQQIARLFDLHYSTTASSRASPGIAASSSRGVVEPREESGDPNQTENRRNLPLRASFERGLAWFGHVVQNAPRIWWVLGLAAMLAAAIAAIVVGVLLEPPVEIEQPSGMKIEPPPAREVRWQIAKEPLQRAGKADIEIEPLVRQYDVLDILAICFSWLLVSLGVGWIGLPEVVRRWRRERAGARRRQLTAERRRLGEAAEREPTSTAILYQVRRHPPLERWVAEDSAGILGRLFGAADGHDLDVMSTLRATLRQGGLLTPVYADRAVMHELVVLVDIEQGDHPWLAGIDWLLERWQVQGVRLACFVFQFDPLFVESRASRLSLPLERLARQSDGGPLLVISRTLSSEGFKSRAQWLRHSDAWPVKAWLDPDPRPMGERRSEVPILRRLKTSGLQRFPFSGDGLIALARYLISEGQGVRSPGWEHLKPKEDPAVAEALRKWALLAALVPDANWEQLEDLRQSFPELRGPLPDRRYVQRLLDWLADQNQNRQPESEDGRTLELSGRLVEKLIREQRRLDAGLPLSERLEVRGRQLLLKQLDATQPDDDLLRLFWQLKRAGHLIAIEPNRILEVIEPLVGTAVESELVRVIKLELERQAAGLLIERGVKDRIEILTAEAGKRLTPTELITRIWSVEFVLATLLLFALCIGLGYLDWLKGEVFDQRREKVEITVTVPAIETLEEFHPLERAGETEKEPAQ